jgi:Fe-S cluster biogenesis protein NfuA/nitrite reductase/ring-hydroxylating ferredoxin subunit
MDSQQASPLASTGDLASTGERIERLLSASDSSGPVARARSEELVRLVADLYGAGLERMLELLYDAGALDDGALDALAGDELVAGLLVVHGLHPYPVEERVLRALDDVRPYLGSHGGDVELVEVTDEGAVRLRMLGSCDGCPSSAVTLQLAVEGAILAAAPEISAVEVVEEPRASTPSVIPIESLTVRLREGGSASSWHPIETGELATGRLTSMRVADLDIVVCRLGSATYAYRDGCPSCGSSLAGAPVERRLGEALGSGVLTCPGCRSHYDLQHAGAGLDNNGAHLSPLPLLERDGVIEVAVAIEAEAAGLPA